MFIIGAGLAGLLAGVVNQTAQILEASAQLPDNHQAVFRMRTNQIGTYTGIPFKKVTVHKAIWFEAQEHGITPRLANLYSQKITGKISQRSILGSLAPAQRWVPPKDFVELLSEKCADRIYFNHVANKITPDTIHFANGGRWDRTGQPIISTIPMPVLMRTLLDTQPTTLNFDSTRIIINHYAVANCDTYATIYYPAPGMTVYRATIDGGTLITEGLAPITTSDLADVVASFGLHPHMLKRTLANSEHKGLKVLPIDTAIRHRLIYQATTQYRIFSLGRYATWRPGVMLDDVFKDIFVITRLIAQDDYSINRQLQKGDASHDTHSETD